MTPVSSLFLFREKEDLWYKTPSTVWFVFNGTFRRDLVYRRSCYCALLPLSLPGSRLSDDYLTNLETAHFYAVL